MAVNYAVTGRADDPYPTRANTMSATYGGLAGKAAPTFTNTAPTTFGGGTSGQRFADLQSALGGVGYQRSGVQRQRAMSLDDLGRQFADMRRGIPGQLNRRGMLDSGQFQRALGRSYADELRNAGRTEMSMQDALNQLAMQQFGAESQFAQSGLNNALSSAERRAQLASQIRETF
jgi:hypothetical protein